jgi:hypothetical protein
MTESEEQEWQERLQAAVGETLRKRAAKRAERQQFAADRDAGLVQRHAQKLARGSRGHQRGRGPGETEAPKPLTPQSDPGEPMPELPPCCAGLDEPCAQHRQAAREIPHQGPRSRSGRPRPVMGESGKARPKRNMKEQP